MLLGPLAEEGGGALTVHPYWIVVSIVQFLLLFYLLRRFLWGPIQSALATRAEKIREGLAAAEEAKAERERMKQEVEELLAKARREAGELAERTTQAAEAAAGEIRAQAKTDADQLRERGRADARQLHDQSLAELRSELAAMVVFAASRVLGKEVDASTHRALIERSLDEAGSELGRPS